MGSRALTSRSYDQTTPTCVLTIAQCQRTTTFDELTASPCFRTTASCRVTSAPWLPSTITSKVTATSDIERLTDAGESHPLRYNRASLDEEFDSLISRSANRDWDAARDRVVHQRPRRPGGTANYNLGIKAIMRGLRWPPRIVSARLWRARSPWRRSTSYPPRRRTRGFRILPDDAQRGEALLVLRQAGHWPLKLA